MKAIFYPFASLLLATAGIARAECRNHPTAYDLISDPWIVETVFQHNDRIVKNIAPSGAIGQNLLFENGARKEWFIENQRLGADAIEAGIMLNRPDWIQTGLRAFQWGFSKQAADGSFPGSGDPFRSTSVFVSAVARAVSAYQQVQGRYPNLKPAFDDLIPRLHQAALWLIDPNVLKIGRYYDRQLTHRRWVLAAALGETARLTNDPTLAQAAEYFARKGLARQRQNGVNPEKGGYNPSYQLTGMLEAARYATSLNCAAQANLKMAVQQMLARALDWEAGRISPEGALDTFKYMEAIEALTYGAQVVGDPAYRNIAQTIAKRKRQQEALR